MSESYESFANKYLNEGNYVEAIKYYLFAAKSYQEDGGIFLEDAANCYNNASTLYTEMGNFDRAIIYYQKAIACYLKIEPDIEDKKSLFHNIVAVCEDIAISSTASENYDDGSKFFLKALEFLTKILEMEDDLIKRYINNQIVLDYSLCSLCFIMNNEEEKAVNFVKKAAEIAHGAKSSQQTEISTLTSIYTVHILKRNHDAALKLLKEEIEPNAPLFSCRSTGLQAQIMTLLYKVFHKYFPGEQMYYYKEKIEEGIVKIREKAYRMIALHSMFFGNRDIARAEWKEIYGLLIGKVNNEDVIITDAIPITSGKKYEVEFESEHYSKAAEIDSIAAEKDLFVTGWYHSHPGIGLFLSNTDVKNHMGYQSINPKAVALVFDFTDLDENNLGFKIFKLDNPSSHISKYHLISWKIIKGTAPNYKEIINIHKDFIENIISLMKSRKSMGYEEISKTLDVSKFIVAELLPEIIKRHGLDIILDQENQRYITKDLLFRKILNLSREFNPLPIKNIVSSFGMTKEQAFEILEEMVQTNLIHGEIHRASEQFVKK
ncbi:MAG: tetratricopeptide repeat protein [Candidatus Lokiarchaeota archaeon]|nr:tetratricopeptide repeat protein [Candidatus Lokiarchaeota archaeon]